MVLKPWKKNRKHDRPRKCRALAGPELLERREMLSAAPPYLVPVAPGVSFTPLITVGESVAETSTPASQYRMVGIPDGMGAFDNNNGTFTVLMNHELASNTGIPREHGSQGAFVSKWIIDKKTLKVLSGDDLIQKVYVWSTTENKFVVGTQALAALNRLCSADLPAKTAFFNAATGKGTQERIFMNGEETANGRAFAHIVSNGESYELPWTGKYAWENHVTSPYAQDKTIVVGLDDSNRGFSSEGAADPSEVYVWVGNKQSEGSVIEKAGLKSGVLYGLRVGVPGQYDANEGSVTSGERFELVGLTDQTNNATAQPLQAESIAKTITQFRRVEDGHWDPNNRNVFYFVTTDRFDSVQDPGTAPFLNNGGVAQTAFTRLWRLTFDDITNPTAGGKIEIMIDGTGPEQMLDNMTVNFAGDVLLQEDPGGQPYLAKIRQFDVQTKDLITVAQHNPVLFDPHTTNPPHTNDEESSGIIDLSEILGKGYYMVNVQAHRNLADPELVQDGQLLVMNTNVASLTLANRTLTVQGTINDDVLEVSRHGNNVTVSFNGKTLGTVKKQDFDRISIDGGAGSDLITIDDKVQAAALAQGGLGNDVIRAGGGRSILIGGRGADVLLGGSDDDILVANDTNLSQTALAQALTEWSGGGNYSRRVANARTFFNSSTLIDDGMVDTLFGEGGLDWFLASVEDSVIDPDRREIRN